MSKEKLISLLRYDDQTGNLHWIYPPRNGVSAGKIAGFINTRGYVHIRFAGVTYKAHRIIWEIVNGVAPDLEIDHINRVTYDNRISNLRLATSSQNKANRAIAAKSKSGYVGVKASRTKGKWVAIIIVNGIRRQIGTFMTKEEASMAYRSALIDAHGQFAV